MMSWPRMVIGSFGYENGYAQSVAGRRAMEPLEGGVNPKSLPLVSETRLDLFGLAKLGAASWLIH